MSIIESIAGFVLCSLVVVYAGAKLSKHGNIISELTGLGKAWIGLILMATVTSLPELFSGISSVVIVKEPDLAAGDVYGSCVFNLLILSVLDALYNKSITSVVRNTHVFAGACGIVLISISGVGLLLDEHLPQIGWISSITPLIFIVYFFSIWLIFKFENKFIPSVEEIKETTSTSNIKSLRRTILMYGLNAMIVIAAGLMLPYFGQSILELTGMKSTFFGTSFLAASTSLPELVVSIAALRMGSLDMAVGNLFGSNIFNIFILGIDDLFFSKGSLFSYIDHVHLISILFIITMTAVAMIGFLFKSEQKKFLLATDTLIILILYVALMVVLYKTG